MKKLVALILTLSMVFALCGCGERKSEEVQNVERLIAAIGEVSLDREKYITDAEQAYAALLEADKELVENAEELVAAREAYSALLRQKAEEVSQAIDAIGKVTLEKEAEIAAAEEAYSALPEEAKPMVENYKVLTDARYSLDVLTRLFEAQERGQTTIEIDGVKVSYLVDEDRWAVVENELTEEYEPADLAYQKSTFRWTSQNLLVTADVPTGWHIEKTTEQGFALANRDVTKVLYIWSAVLTEQQKQHDDAYSTIDAVATEAIGSSRQHGEFHHSIYAQRRASWCRVDMDGYDTVFVFMLDGNNLVVLQAYSPDKILTKDLLGIAVHCVNNMTIGKIE